MCLCGAGDAKRIRRMPSSLPLAPGTYYFNTSLFLENAKLITIGMPGVFFENHIIIIIPNDCYQNYKYFGHGTKHRKSKSQVSSFNFKSIQIGPTHTKINVL